MNSTGRPLHKRFTQQIFGVVCPKALSGQWKVLRQINIDHEIYQGVKKTIHFVSHKDDVAFEDGVAWIKPNKEHYFLVGLDKEKTYAWYAY